VRCAAPTSSRTASIWPSTQNPAAWAARVASCRGWPPRSAAKAAATAPGVNRRAEGATGSGTAVAASIDSTPHNPQPTGPAMCRRRAASRPAAASDTHT